jgi:thiamine-phosphate pyrophosphorylase
MHISRFYIYTFIDSFDENKILSFSNNHGVIYRNYEHKIDLKTIFQIKKVCKRNKIKFYLANNIKLALQANLDGVYIPSFNKSLNLNNFKNKRKDFTIMGSAHSISEMKFKEKQGINLIFLSPLFLTKDYKESLGIIKFNLISRLTSKKIIALGGIRKKNLNKLKILNAIGFSGITIFN